MGSKMAGSKIRTLLLVVLLLAVPTAALELKVEVSNSIDHGAYELSYKKDVQNIQEMNLTVENLGSIGCKYRMRAVFNQSGKQTVHYSKPLSIWPGDSAVAKIRYIPFNYTGKVETATYLDYCGKKELIENFSFNTTAPEENSRNLDAREIKANSSNTEVKLDLEEGALVPLKAPTGWKVSSASVNQGAANLEYEAPIFSPKENITYAVVDNSGNILGKTKVRLDIEQTLWDKLESNIWQILFLVSAVLNIGLFLLRDSLITKIKALK